MQYTGSKLFKTISLLTALIFTAEQVLLASPEPVSFQSTLSSTREAAPESDDTLPVPLQDSLDLSQEFLQGEVPLQTVGANDDSVILPPALGADRPGGSGAKQSESSMSSPHALSGDLQVMPANNRGGLVRSPDGLRLLSGERGNDIQEYAFERYTVDDALAFFDEDYAAAAVLEGLERKDLERILDLPFEAGIAVLEGEIVLFSTGSAEEIGILEPARELLKSSSFISHTHVTESSQDGPSQFDLEHAVESPDTEYVLTREGVYAYRNGRVLNENSPYSLDTYLALLDEAVRDAEITDLTAARRHLNEFIVQMDAYNEAANEEKDVYRKSGPVSAFADDFNRTTGLGPDWVKTSGNPVVSSNKFVFMNSYPVHAGRAYLNKEFTSGDYEIEADVYMGGAITAHGFLFRYQDDLNYYRLGVDKWGRVFLQKSVDGWLTSVGNTGSIGTPDQNAWNHIKLVVEGSTFKVYYKGNLKFETTDTGTPYTGGKVGLFTDVYGEQFDNFSVAVLGNVTPTVTAPTANSLPFYTNQTTLTLTGTKEAGTSIWINGAEAVAADSATTWSHDMTLSTEQLYSFSITARDVDGNESQAANVQTTYDGTLPAGSISINGEDSDTNSLDVTLTLTGSDALSGLDAMRISADGGTTWSAWEAFAASKAATLPAGDGTKTVKLELRDKAGNIAAFSDTIVLDTVPPDIVFTSPTLTNHSNYTLTYTVDGTAKSVAKTLSQEGSNGLSVTETDAAGNQTTANLTVTLDTIAPAIVVTSASLTNDPANYELVFTVDGTQETLSGAALEAVRVPTGALAEGGNTFRIIRQDAAGNETTKEFTLTVDTIAPEIIFTSPVISNDPASYALAFTVDGIQESLSGAALEAVRLPAGALTEGSNTLRIVRQDVAGNSAAFDFVLAVDTVKPAGSIEINNGAAVTEDSSVTVALNVSDNGSGLDQYRYSLDGGLNWENSWTDMAAAFSANLTGPDGEKTVTVEVRDHANNSNFFEATITLETPQPPPTEDFIFTDDFNRTELGENWTPIGGNYRIYNGALYGKAWSAGQHAGALLNIPLNSNDYELSVSGQINTLQGEGFVVRYQDPDNYYFVSVDQWGRARIYKKSGGVQSLIFNGSVGSVQKYVVHNLRLRLEGNVFQYYFDGQLKYTFEDTNNPHTTGQVGIYTYHMYNYNEAYDDFSIQTLGGVTGPPVTAPTVTALPEYTNQSLLTLTGTKEAGTSIWINGAEAVAADSATVWSHDMTLSTEQLYAFSITARDQNGNESTAVTVETTYDGTKPTGSVTVNSGDTTTSDTNVTLTLTSADTLSGIDAMRTSVDGGATWTSWEALAASKDVTLPEEDGVKTVRIQLRDKAGNIAEFVDAIGLNADGSDPLIFTDAVIHSAKLDNGAQDLTPTQFEILDGGSVLHLWGNNWKAIDFGVQIQAGSILEFDYKRVGPKPEKSAIGFSNTTNLSSNPDYQHSFELEGTQANWPMAAAFLYTGAGDWQHYAIPAGQFFTGGFAYLLLYNDDDANLAADAYFRNINLTHPNVSVPVPTVDATPAYTNQTTFTLTGTKDAGTSIWINGAEAVAADSATTWSHDVTLGTEQLYSFSITAKDADGNESSAVTVETTYDGTKPSGQVTINSDDAYTQSTAVTLNLSAADALSGVSEMRFAINGTDETDYSNWEPFSASKDLTLPNFQGTNYVNVEVRDKAGNKIWIWDSIVLDSVKPAASVTIKGGDTYTDQRDVTLQIAASDATSGLAEMRFAFNSTDEADYGAWIPFDANPTVILPDFQGENFVNVRVRDAAGNVTTVFDSIILDTIPPDLQTNSPYFQPLTSAEGLEGYWDFEDVTGTTVADQSGNSHDGTLVNGVSVSADHAATSYQNSSSLRFDGVDDYVEVTNDPALNFGLGDFSISLWINPDTVSVAKQGILNKTDGTSGYRLITSDTDGDRLKFIRGANFADGIQSSDGALQAGAWQHILVVVASGQVTFYVNGTAQGSGALKSPSSSSGANLFIGQKGYSGSTVNFFDGSIDDVQIFNRALAADEIQTLAGGDLLGSAPPAINTTSLTVDYTLDGVAGSETFDSLVEGENDLVLTKTDEAGNSATLTGKVIVDLPDAAAFPEIVFTSASTAASASYDLTYTVDGNPASQSVTLQEGANVFTVEESNAAGTTVAHFVVVLNGLPEVAKPDENLKFNLDLEGSQAELVAPVFDEGGLLQGGWLELANGVLIKLTDGRIAEEYRPDGSRVLYDAAGRVHSRIEADLTATHFSYEVDSDEALIRILIVQGGNRVILDGSGAVLEFQRDNGSAFIYDAGLLVEYVSEGVRYDYSVSATAQGFESQLIGPTPPAETPIPQTLTYDTNKKLISLLQSDGTLYEFDASGAVSRVVDAEGTETVYVPEANPFGLLEGMVVEREGLTRKYAADGSLAELVDDQGTTFFIENNEVAGLRASDGTLYDELLYDEDGNLLNARITLPNGRVLYFEGEEKVKVIEINGTTNEFSAGKPTFSATKEGMVYEYSEQTDTGGNPYFTSELVRFVNPSGGMVFMESGRVSKVENAIDGIVNTTIYQYDPEGKLIHVSILRDGTSVGEFDYEYVADETAVTNHLGSVRYYDESGNLLRLITDGGMEYGFSSFTENGEDRILQTLLRIVDAILGTVDYVDGKPMRLERTDGIVARDITVDAENALVSATVDYPGGAVGLIQAGELKKITEADGTVKDYMGGLIRKITDPALAVTTFNYELAADKTILSITVTDVTGTRTYRPDGTLLKAVSPDGKIYDYDTAGVLTKITTLSNLEFNYINGTLNDIRFLGTGESLTGVSISAGGGLVAGTFNSADGAVYIISGGRLVELRKNGSTYRYDAAGDVYQIITPAGDLIEYNPHSLGKDDIVQITRADGKWADKIDADASDRLFEARMDLADGFTGIIANPIFGASSGKRPMINGIVWRPGSGSSLSLDMGLTTTFGFTGNFSQGLLDFSTISTDPGKYDGIRGDADGANLAGAGYLKVGIKKASNSTSISARYELLDANNNVVYTLNYDLSATSSTTEKEHYFPIPQGLGFIKSFRLTFPRTEPAFYLLNAGFVSRNDFVPSDWLGIATPYVNEKRVPSIPSQLGAAAALVPAMTTQSQGFQAAASFDTSNTSEEVWSASSIRSHVQNAALEDSAVVSAVYDDNLQLLAWDHADPAFDAGAGPDETWKKALFGWEEVGFAFGPAALTPPKGTALAMTFSTDGKLADTRFQGNTAAKFENERVKTVISPEGKVFHYEYAQAAGNPALDRVLLEADSEDPTDTEIDYAYDKIREVKRNGEAAYLYRYEFDENGNEITVVEDVAAEEERHFLGERLLSVFGLSTGFLTEYTYDLPAGEAGTSERIIQAVTSRAGRTFATYAYTYDAQDTIIADDDGTMRRYDAEGVLKRLTRSNGETYDYSFFSDGIGEDLLLQELVQITNALQGTADYQDGRPTRVLSAEGIEIKDIVLDENDQIVSGQVRYPEPDGRIALIQDYEVIHVTAPGGEVEEFANGFLERRVDADNNLTTLTYTKDTNGQLLTITVEDNDGLRIYTAGGVLTRAELPDTTEIDYNPNGTISKIKSPAGDNLLYSNGTLVTVLFAAGQGHIDSIVLNADGTISSGVFSKDGATLLIQNGIVTQKTLANGTVFYYGANGKINEIREPTVESGGGLSPPGGNFYEFYYDVNGTLTQYERPGGRWALDIVADASDRIVSAEIKTGQFEGYILGADGKKARQNYQPIAGGVLREPGLSGGGTGVWLPTSSASFLGSSVTGHLLYGVNGDNAYQGFSGSLSSAGSGAGYIKVGIQEGNPSNNSTSIRFELLDDTGNIIHSKTYSVSLSASEVDHYFEIPEGLTNIGSFRLLVPRGEDLYLLNAEVVDRADFVPSDWIELASEFAGQKTAPVVPVVINATLAAKPALETRAQEQFLLPSPPELDQGVAIAIYGEAQTLVDGRFLEDDKIIASAFSKTDGQLLMAVRKDGTAVHYRANGQIDRLEDKDGNLLIDYEYGADDELLAVNFIAALNDLEAEYSNAQLEIAKRALEILTDLAVQRQLAIDGIMAQLNQALAMINSERQRLREIAEQRVCRRVFFVKTCETIYTDVSGPMRQLDEQERAVREQAAEELAKLDVVVRDKKLEIEAEQEMAFVELEKQRAVTFRETLKQGLRPVITDTYRRLIGRDPSTEEMDAWLLKEIGNQELTLASLMDTLEFHSLDFEAASVSYDELKRLVGLSDHGILAHAGALQYVMVTSIDLVDGIEQVTLVQRERGGRKKRFVTGLVPWLDANGNPIIDSEGNPLYIEQITLEENEAGFAGREVTMTKDEFLALWDVSGAQEGLIISHIPVDTAQVVLLTEPEMQAITGAESWDIAYEFLKRTFGLNLERIDVAVLSQEILASAEYAGRLDDVNAIKAAVRDFLLNQYFAADTAGQEALLASLGLAPEEVIGFSAREAETVLDWLDSRDLHFGHSAFYALMQLLEEAGRSVTLFDVALETILIDIFVGVIHPLTSGDLEISLFALKRVGANHGVDLTAAKVTYEELKRELAAGGGKGILVHISGNHYVVVTEIGLVQKTDEAGRLVFDENGDPVMVESVSYIEKNVGPAGQTMTVEMEQFLEFWVVGQNQDGYVLTPIEVAPEAEILTDEQAKKITGAFFLEIIAFIALMIFQIASAVAAVAAFIVTTVIPNLIVLAGQLIAGIVQAIAGVGQFLIGFAKEFFAGIKLASQFLLKGITSGFGFLKAGLANLGKFLVFPGGPKFLAGALSPTQLVARQVIGIALGVGSGKVLEKLGINPVIANLGSAFLTGGIMGLVGGGLGVGASSTFLGSALKSLAIAGVNELALHLDLPPPLTTALSLISGTLAGNILDPSSLPQALQSLVPTLIQEVAVSGLVSLGNHLGLDPRLTAILSIPARATIGGVLYGLGNPNVSVLDAIKSSLLSKATLGGLVSVGSSIGLDAIDAPPILQSFLPGLLGQLVANSGGGGPPPPEEVEQQGQSLFGKILDGISKFGQGVVGAVGSVISFGAKVIEGVGSLTKAGFAKAGEFFSAIFDQRTIEDLTNGGTQSIETALNNNCSVITDGIHCAYKSVEIDYLINDDQLTYSNVGTSATFDGLNKVGEFFGGSIAFADESGPDGIKLVNTYEGGQLSSIEILDDLVSVLEVKPFDQNIPLSMQGGMLTNAQIVGGAYKTAVSIIDGQVNSIHKRDYASILINEFGDAEIVWGIDESNGNVAVTFAVDIYERYTGDDVEVSFDVEISEEQRKILDTYNLDYQLIPEAFAGELETQQAESSGTLLSNVLDYFDPNTSKAYQRLNEGEKEFLFRNPTKAILINDSRILAENLSTAFAVLTLNNPTSVHNGKADALRHALWAALLTKEIGAEKALEFVTLHESFDTAQPVEEMLMDTHNNEVGIQLVADMPDAPVSELVALLKEKINNSELIWLNNE